MMVQFRSVDCDSKKPLKFDPGYIGDVIHEVGIRKNSNICDQLHACGPHNHQMFICSAVRVGGGVPQGVCVLRKGLEDGSAILTVTPRSP
jgi:hypothetical protein